MPCLKNAMDVETRVQGLCSSTGDVDLKCVLFISLLGRPLTLSGVPRIQDRSIGGDLTIASQIDFSQPGTVTQGSTYFLASTNIQGS